MSMDDQGPNIPGAPDTKHAASQPVPSDKEIPYTFKSIKDPTLLPPGGQGRMPGHKQTYDAAAARAEAAARYAASEAESRAKSDAQFKADTGQSPPLHPTPKVAPKSPARSAGKKGK